MIIAKGVIERCLRAIVCSPFGYNFPNTEKLIMSNTILHQSQKIKAAAFSEIADKLYKMSELNMVYKVSNGLMKYTNKEYSTIENDYEITFTKDTKIENSETNEDIPKIEYNFIKINGIYKLQDETIIDTLGVIYDARSYIRR